ncbi:DUF1828 domain-containing protein [Myxococcota bacterium]|nr:DUF1828 domain-containing protein [Myxococcota bacterium]
MINSEQLRDRLAQHPLVRSIDTLRTGPLRIETAFLYPDGASIDLFLCEEPSLFPAPALSDLGQTMSWLLDVQVKPWLSRKRQALLDDALRLYGVEQRGGELVKPLTSADDVLPGLVLLGQACVRTADLQYTKRSVLVTSFSEQVEESLIDAEVPYTPNVELEGRFSQAVRVDFLAEGPRLRSAILTLSSGNTSQAHICANEIFRKWYDLNERNEQRLTVLDDRADVYREEDLRRIRDLSDIVALSDRQTLRDLLMAA